MGGWKFERDLPQKFFFWVGMIAKRKNLETLYRAFSIFSKSFPGFQLVIAGKFADYETEIRHKKLVASLKISGKVLFTGYVSDRELVALYKKAFAFVFPSIHPCS